MNSNRVGAIQASSNTKVLFFGYGILDGKSVTLDDGRVLQSSQCWCVPEEKAKEIIGDREIIPAKVCNVTPFNLQDLRKGRVKGITYKFYFDY